MPTSLFDQSTDPSSYRRRLAALLMQQGMDASPVGHWTQGAARMANALVGGLIQRQETEEQTKADKETAALTQQLLGGGMPDQPVVAPQAAAQPASLDQLAVNRAVPASIRTNNPGAQYPGPSATAFGSTGHDVIGGGHKIARFNTPEEGGAAQFDLLARRYVGKPLGAAIAEWSGNNNAPAYIAQVSRATGMTPDTVLTPAILRSPQGIQLVQAMAQHEAGRPFPMKPEQWQAAQARAFGGTGGADTLAGGTDDLRPQQMAQAQDPRTAAAMQILNNRRALPQARAFAQQFLLENMKRDVPTFGDIGTDVHGRPLKGFVNPRRQQVTPYTPPGTAIAGQSEIPPVRPGADPVLHNKIWSEHLSKRGLPPSEEDQGKMRAEIRQLPSYKNLAEAAPIYKNMFETAGRTDKYSDLNLVYGLSKIFDPGSVVREGEQILVRNAASLPEWLRGQISAINGGAALTPASRESILREAHTRMSSYKGVYDTETATHRRIAKRRGMDPEDIVPDLGTFEQWTPPEAKSEFTQEQIDAEKIRRAQQGRR